MKKLLPPILFILTAVVMGIVCWGTGSEHNILYPYNLFGLFFLAVGLGMASWGSRLFRRLGTNIMTFDEPDVLVTQGLYRFTRNPMYLGFVIAILGIAILYQGAIVAFVLAFLFFIVTDRWYIKFEERAMLSKFGEEYQNYCNNTRRWI